MWGANVVGLGNLIAINFLFFEGFMEPCLKKFERGRDAVAVDSEIREGSNGVLCFAGDDGYVFLLGNTKFLYEFLCCHERQGEEFSLFELSKSPAASSCV